MSVLFQLVSANGITVASQELPDAPYRITLPTDAVVQVLDESGEHSLNFMLANDHAGHHPHHLPPDWSLLD